MSTTEHTCADAGGTTAAMCLAVQPLAAYQAQKLRLMRLLHTSCVLAARLRCLSAWLQDLNGVRGRQQLQ